MKENITNIKYRTLLNSKKYNPFNIDNNKDLTKFIHLISILTQCSDKKSLDKKLLKLNIETDIILSFLIVKKEKQLLFFLSTINIVNPESFLYLYINGFYFENQKFTLDFNEFYFENILSSGNVEGFKYFKKNVKYIKINEKIEIKYSGFLDSLNEEIKFTNNLPLEILFHRIEDLDDIEGIELFFFILTNENVDISTPTFNTFIDYNHDINKPFLEKKTLIEYIILHGLESKPPKEYINNYGFTIEEENSRRKYRDILLKAFSILSKKKSFNKHYTSTLSFIHSCSFAIEKDKSEFINIINNIK